MQCSIEFFTDAAPSSAHLCSSVTASIEIAVPTKTPVRNDARPRTFRRANALQNSFRFCFKSSF